MVNLAVSVLSFASLVVVAGCIGFFVFGKLKRPRLVNAVFVTIFGGFVAFGLTNDLLAALAGAVFALALWGAYVRFIVIPLASRIRLWG